LPKSLPRLAPLLLCALLGLAASAGELQRIDGVRLIPTDWADGDSFQVEFPNGERHTLRLYGADCFEWHVSDDTDARRLRAQRRWFGITDYGDDPRESIELAKSLGAAAGTAIRELLAHPFTVHTSFADARGDGRYKRIYAFVTLPDGRDLATVLVQRGLARAHGVSRTTPDGTSRNDYRQRLQDTEFCAAAGREGAWVYTDWQRLITERDQQRQEDRDDELATGKAPPTAPLDLNTAARDELMRIPGIGEHFANAIIENRPYRTLEELLRVPGIGYKRLAKLREWVNIQP
jgi:competence protein ComEA